MAVADSVGHMFEFLPVVDVPYSSGHGFSLETFKDMSKDPEVAPAQHHHCTITALSPHHHRTITAPSPHQMYAFQNIHNRFRLKLGQW